ncbi:hypothetical protein HU200_000808 [Digitaria exilis]|uniref:Uncharacterized protein n=1 Tax=Digitaria exilis TaxID=1010633 RepID=A0A835FXW4_9POAL|nr:hypothetical protein HU200_000808 [Digitaria exilis]
MDGVSGKGIVFIPVKGEGSIPVWFASTIVCFCQLIMPSGSASETEAIKVDRSIEFSYEELCDATNNFSTEHKIGQGGFGSVYYAMFRGEVRLIGTTSVDVCAFGIVLYGLISAEEAIVKSTESTDATSLVYLHENCVMMTCVLCTRLHTLRSHARCTHEEPRMRPTMRSVVALMALSSKEYELTRGLEFSPRGPRYG